MLHDNVTLAWCPAEATGVIFDPDIFATFSASLPAIFGLPARKWNGRDLTSGERRGALREAALALHRTRPGDSGSQWFAAQAAHEWLSREAW